MESKEIKSTLKAIKDSINQKDYKSALKQCKSILKVDRNNYLALVFYGVSVQETEQKDEAPKAFKKAIEIAPENIVAWQGLALFYEKNDSNCDLKDLLKVYAKLLILENNVCKLQEVGEKFTKLAVSFDDTSDLKMICDLTHNIDDKNKKLFIQECLVSIMAAKPNLSKDLMLNYHLLLEDFISIRPYLNNYLDFLKKYLKLLYKERNFVDVMKCATEGLKSHPDDITILEWVCKVYTEISKEVLEKDLLNYSPKDVYTKLLAISPDSYLGFLCKGVYELYCNDLLNACESLKNSAKINSSLGIIWFKLCVCQVLLYQFSDAEQSALKALQYFERNEKEDENVLVSKIKLLNCLCEQDSREKWLEAEKLGQKLLETNMSSPNNLEVLQYLIKVLTKLNKYSEAEKLINQLKNNEAQKCESEFLISLLLKQQNKITECKNILKSLVAEMPEHGCAWLELGKIYYFENNCTSCLSCLLKSTKLNQWCYWNYIYLGHCYRTMVLDLEKARRCYQKAFQLNPSNVEVGTNLSDVYRILGKEELNMQFLSAVVTNNPRLKWPRLKLGLHYLSVNQYQEAVNSLQVAVRLDSDDKNAWECLGDAYYAQGAYTSALKSYQRVGELDENSIYPMLQIANIKHLIGSYNESVQEFRLLLKRTPDYIPVLKGHSEACSSLMKHYLSQNLNGLARDACQEAVNSLIKCLQQQKSLICIWKLLGDSCTLLSNLPEKYCNLNVLSWLPTNSQHQDEDSETTLNKDQILKLGFRCYCQAIALNPNFSNLWYDLAFIYNCMVQIRNTEESRKQMRELAYSAVKKSILLNRNSWESWNLYGIILASQEFQKYRLAQHCFIQGIKINDTNAISWTNLGALYLKIGDFKIANKSFTEAQKYDHDYVHCWVGQAIIAQETAHSDAMDLFRHSTNLGFSTEGHLGYTNLVCQTLLDTKCKDNKNYIYSIKNMNAITVASDLLTWYTDRFITNSWAFNMLGLLLERQLLYKRSAEAFSQALKTLRLKKTIDENDHSDKILLNYSRVLSNLKRYDEAIEHLKKIQKATFQSQCELAAAYYRNKLYEEAYASYETTLEWLAPNTEVKSHILVAMAAVVYLHQGQEDAKLLLMQSYQLKPPSVQGLFALCALGMLHSDLALSELALKELSQYKNDVRYLSHIAVFQGYIHLFKGQKEKAIRALCEITHRHPNQPILWLSLSLLLLHLHSSFDCKSAARCAEVSLRTGRSSIDVSKVMSLVSLSNLLSGEGIKSLRSSQKAVHMFPDVTENWVVVVASVLSKSLIQKSTKDILWLQKMITYIRRKFVSSKPMTQWLSNNNRKIIMMADNLAN